jgi:hypothetical protein
MARAISFLAGAALAVYQTAAWLSLTRATMFNTSAIAALL